MSYTVYIRDRISDDGVAYIFTYNLFAEFWKIREPGGTQFIMNTQEGIENTIGPYLRQRFGINTANILRRVDTEWVFYVKVRPSALIATGDAPDAPDDCNVEPCCEPEYPSPHTQTSNHPRRRYLTMMPTSSFSEVASILSTRDLKYMRIVSLRVLRKLLDPSSHRRKAVCLWVGHTQALIRYGMAIAKEIVSRGGTDTSMAEFQDSLEPGRFYKPTWVYWPRLQNSNCAYLVLRGIRDQAVSELHKLDLNNEGGLRRLLIDKVGETSPRNLTINDIRSLGFDSSFTGYYSSRYDIPGLEDFVYPSSVC